MRGIWGWSDGTRAELGLSDCSSGSGRRRRTKLQRRARTVDGGSRQRVRCWRVPGQCDGRFWWHTHERWCARMRQRQFRSAGEGTNEYDSVGSSNGWLGPAVRWRWGWGVVRWRRLWLVGGRRGGLELDSGACGRIRRERVNDDGWGHDCDGLYGGSWNGGCDWWREWRRRTRDPDTLPRVPPVNFCDVSDVYVQGGITKLYRSVQCRCDLRAAVGGRWMCWSELGSGLQWRRRRVRRRVSQKSPPTAFECINFSWRWVDIWRLLCACLGRRTVARRLLSGMLWVRCGRKRDWFLWRRSASSCRGWWFSGTVGCWGFCALGRADRWRRGRRRPE